MNKIFLYIMSRIYEIDEKYRPGIGWRWYRKSYYWVITPMIFFQFERKYLCSLGFRWLEFEIEIIFWQLSFPQVLGDITIEKENLQSNSKTNQ